MCDIPVKQRCYDQQLDNRQKTENLLIINYNSKLIQLIIESQMMGLRHDGLQEATVAAGGNKQTFKVNFFSQNFSIELFLQQVLPNCSFLGSRN